MHRTTMAPEITKCITDRTQYAYKPNKSKDDAMITLLNRVTVHIDRAAGSYVKAVFIDFSSVFNTIIPCISNLKNGAERYRQ